MEAVLVLPVVLAVILLVTYLLLFQYGRCMQEQETGVLALGGCILPAADNDELMIELKRFSDGMYKGNYPAWESGERNIELKGDTVKVKQEGRLCFPFGKWKILNLGNQWSASVAYENDRINPVLFLRICRKVKGGK